MSAIYQSDNFIKSFLPPPSDQTVEIVQENGQIFVMIAKNKLNKFRN